MIDVSPEEVAERLRRCSEAAALLGDLREVDRVEDRERVVRQERPLRAVAGPARHPTR